MQETHIPSLGREDPLKEMAAYSSILAWGNPLDKGAWQATVHGVHLVSYKGQRSRTKSPHSGPDTASQKQ